MVKPIDNKMLRVVLPVILAVASLVIVDAAICLPEFITKYNDVTEVKISSDSVQF